MRSKLSRKKIEICLRYELERKGKEEAKKRQEKKRRRRRRKSEEERKRERDACPIVGRE